ncbi:hypothetical protein Ahy_A10g050136 [Arachis hypogaea]|uniref:Uncharacterized protein n=1 Tax=Arachis hypogaea TaxID=3818 RepID=A0A445B8Q1_ARAHY|nr:hypothetical protein Ahy_A10g050136 [Arachis hypogaea]
MSDIAMLVAEEYERRTKNLKKVEGEMTLVSSSLLLGLTERLVKDKRLCWLVVGHSRCGTIRCADKSGSFEL